MTKLLILKKATAGENEAEERRRALEAAQNSSKGEDK